MSGVEPGAGWKKTLLFWGLLLAVPVLVLYLLLPPLWRQLADTLRPELVAWVATHLPAEERERIRSSVASIATGWFRVVPDPAVGRIARSGVQVVEKEALVVTNNAGLRSNRPYGPKPADVFRIVCLGDSFVFGTGGPEQDRFCQQIEDFYREQQVTVGSRRIEALAVGLPSWTMRQEASYLAARIDDYAPDVIIMTSCQNDITDSSGVTEDGSLTSAWASDRREVGSGVFSNTAGLPFGGGLYSALTTDLCPTCRAYWRQGFEPVGRLGELQRARGGHLLLSAIELPARHAGFFMQLFQQHAASSGAPYLLTGYLAGKDTRLPHDGHPSRAGHWLLAVHYIRTLAELGWVPLAPAQWPDDPRRHPGGLNPPVDAAVLAAEQQRFISEHLRPAIDFRQLDTEQLPALLGGIFPESEGQLPAGQAPWASVRAGFLLQKPDGDRDATLTLDLQLPARAALYPLPLAISVNGQRLAEPVIAADRAGQTERLQLVVPRSLLAQYPAVEVLLETPRHFAGFEDQRMKSYALQAAAIE